MCTATVFATPFGYQLAFNRDELLSRPSALPPAVREGLLMPRDPEGGGTWIASNAQGLTVMALNVYEAARQEPTPPIRSRGLLVQDVACAATLADVATFMHQPGLLAHTRPVHLLVVAPDARTLDVHWDGETLRLHDGRLPVLRVSAAIDPDAVRAARQQEFAQLTAEMARTTDAAHTLRTWFSSHERHGAPRSVCMHWTPVAGTVSHTQVVVDQTHVTMRYVAGPPCEAGAETVVTMLRV